jgi:Glyoxalase-like domain
MPGELDHVFLWVSAGAPEAEGLVALGLTEGQPNRHPGQGTACRRFFFANAYLELVWVESPEEARGEVARPLRLWERWSGRGAGACPFGVILRPAPPGGPAPPFPAWEYRPPYLPPTLTLHVGVNVDCVEEPLLFYFPVPRRPDSLPMPNRHLLEHGAGFRELTALRIFGPHAAIASPTMQAAEQTAAVVFRRGPEYWAEVGFDGERQGRQADLRPALPLVMCW